MNYEIVATLGPGSNTPTTWEAMLKAGATAFRLNTSHLTLDQLEQWLAKLEEFFDKGQRAIPVVLDLQGSKWRLGQFDSYTLNAGQHIDLVYATATDHPNTLPVPHSDFFQAADSSNGEIVLNDAKVQLVAESIGESSIRTKVIKGDEISPRKGITYTASAYRAESLKEKDRAILERTQGMDFVQYAISYVRDAAEMQAYRAMMGANTTLVAKLERGPAMAEAQQIVQTANALWICRGDLGAELGIPGMAKAVYKFSMDVRAFTIPVLMAGQVLEHMTHHPSPTRSEVCYLYNCLLKGYQGFVLSDEAAIGEYPVESCRVAAMFNRE